MVLLSLSGGPSSDINEQIRSFVIPYCSAIETPLKLSVGLL